VNNLGDVSLLAASLTDTCNRVKQLKEGPYDHKEALAAAGLRIDNGKRENDPGADDVDMAT
jgi:hypothetical protein